MTCRTNNELNPPELNSESISDRLESATMEEPAYTMIMQGILCLRPSKSRLFATLSCLLFSMMKKLTALEMTQPTIRMLTGYLGRPHTSEKRSILWIQQRTVCFLLIVWPGNKDPLVDGRSIFL